MIGRIIEVETNHRVPDPIFVVGAPRSGTTWAAKIFDSHPDVLYRHEPDEVRATPSDLGQVDIPALIQSWCDMRHPRATTKRPFFPKSWQFPAARFLRPAIAYGLMAASRVPVAANLVNHLRLPDMGRVAKARFVIKTVRWCDGIGLAARALPLSRTILIIRRPCAQVHSLMQGVRQGRFELREKGELALDLDRARTCAAEHGVDGAAFDGLGEAARYAWGWVAFNEAAERSVAGLPNVRIVVYEDLAADPIRVARDAFAFAGLSWHSQTEAFVRRSISHTGASGYYDVVQNATIVANRWRKLMAEDDQRAVEDVVRRTRLARHWEDMRQAA
jgi:hypothetical protein